MRILHVITTIDRGGAENQLLLLVKEQLGVGHDVSIFPLKGSLELENQFEAYGANILNSQANASPIKQVLTLRKISRNFDLVHAHLPRAELITFFGAVGKVLVSRHNCEPFFPKYPGVISKFLSRLVQSRAETVIAISDTVKSYLIDKHEVRRRKISVVNYGFDKTIKYTNDIKSMELNGELIIGTVSRLVPQKDLGTLFLAFKEVSKILPRARLAIVGTGQSQKKLSKFADDLQISNQIDWLGRVTDPLTVIAQMDFFVMTSIYEGFGLVVLEAISQEVPVIVSDNQTFKKIFEGREDSLFPVGDHHSLASKILTYSPIDQRTELARSQQGILMEYSSARMIGHMEEIYARSQK